MKNKIIKGLSVAALATGLVVGAGALPAQAVANTFTTYCGSLNPKIIVSGASYNYTAIKSGAVTIASGYGSWSRQLSYDGTFTIVRANGVSNVSYVCN